MSGSDIRERRRFNTCSSCEEQQGCANATFGFDCVSIPAPLARSNMAKSRLSTSRIKRFNTCSSCEEQPMSLLVQNARNQFQYLLLLRGATKAWIQRAFGNRFNTCSSCEEQPMSLLVQNARNQFQYLLLLRGATKAWIQRAFGNRFNTCSSCEEQLCAIASTKKT